MIPSPDLPSSLPLLPREGGQADPQATIARNLRRHAAISADSYAANTRRALDADTRLFQAWCAAHSYTALPAEPQTVGDFVAALVAGAAVTVEGHDRHGRPCTRTLTGVRRPATIERVLASIAHWHRAAGLPFDRTHPEIRQRMRGAKRRLGVRQRQARALRWDELLRLLPEEQPAAPVYDPFWERLHGEERANRKAKARRLWLGALRDRALLLVAYETLCRRAELVALRIENIQRAPEGVTVFVARGKTDQEGEGRHRPLRRRTVAAIDTWLAAVDWTHREGLLARKRARWAVEAAPSVVARGPLFRSIHRSGRVRDSALPASHVPLILKRLAAAAGLDPEAVAGLSGHSTRVGAAQDLRQAGASVLDLQAEGGWRDPRMPGRYTRALDATHGAMARLARVQEGEEG